MNDILNNEELNEVCKTLSDEVSTHDDIKLIRYYSDENNSNNDKENTVTTTTLKDDNENTINHMIKTESNDLNTTNNKTTDNSLFDDEIVTSENNDDIIKSVISENIDDSISNEDVAKLIECVNIYKERMDANPSSLGLYNRLPSFFKEIVNKEIKEEFSENDDFNIFLIRDSIAKTIIEELYNEIYNQNTGVDIDDVVENTFNIPSITDMYQDAIIDEFESKLIPKIQELKESDNEKDYKTITNVMNNFRNGFAYHKTWYDYNHNARIRKMVRKNFSKWKKFADTVNYINKDTEFRMPNAKDCGNILIEKILKYDNSITLIDVQKFLTLVLFSIQYYRENNVINASYCYYILKDIMILKYGNESKESFSTELMNNIIAIIHCIRYKEGVV